MSLMDMGSLFDRIPTGTKIYMHRTTTFAVFAMKKTSSFQLRIHRCKCSVSTLQQLLHFFRVKFAPDFAIVFDASVIAGQMDRIKQPSANRELAVDTQRQFIVRSGADTCVCYCEIGETAGSNILGRAQGRDFSPLLNEDMRCNSIPCTVSLPLSVIRPAARSSRKVLMVLRLLHPMDPDVSLRENTM